MRAATSSSTTSCAPTCPVPAYALFTDPPLGRVGMSEAEVRALGRMVLVGVMPMTRVGRARERGEMQGFMQGAGGRTDTSHPRLA
jgi:pyruvate/2-oxoglutarate dehydrogenase complex dihydrolipoamide dehydrogenase (E3) component